MIRAQLIRRQIFFKYRRHDRGVYSFGWKIRCVRLCDVWRWFGEATPLLGNGSTWQSVSSGTAFTAAGFASVDLPPGQYRFTIETATAVFADVTRVPY
ncbi:MAG: hypothetical protein WBF50_10055 [Pseudolabrys sp.]